MSFEGLSLTPKNGQYLSKIKDVSVVSQTGTGEDSYRIGQGAIKNSSANKY
jgi:hypothetical protein